MKHAVPNTNVDKGVCSYDQTHVFKINGLVTLPFDENALVKGWQISGILAANSGLPMNIQDGYDEGHTRRLDTPAGLCAGLPGPGGKGKQVVQPAVFHS